MAAPFTIGIEEEYQMVNHQAEEIFIAWKSFIPNSSYYGYCNMPGSSFQV